VTAATPGPVRAPEAAPEAELDAALGDWDSSARLSAEADASEEFPAELCSRLDAYGLHRYYVPPRWGGAFDDHELMVRLWRTVSRRDLSTAVAHGITYLGAAPVWLAADPHQAAAAAAAALAGAPFACLLSEPDHGADLVNGSVTASGPAADRRLTGVKWPVNNATRATHVTVLARTSPAGTARGHSMFLLEKAALAPGTWRALPKVATHGLRAIDLSGIEFSGTPVTAGALIGAEGTGIETALRALQLTRTVCAAMSLGAGEHALRLAARGIAQGAALGPRATAAEWAYAGRALARGGSLLAAAEAASLVGARAAHSLTGEMSVVSAVVKSLAPALIDTVTAELTEILTPAAQAEREALPRLARDHHVVSVFDGSTPVNRSALVHQFPRLARYLASGSGDAGGLAEAVMIGTRPRPLDRSALTLMSRSGCSVVQALPAAAEAAAGCGVPGLTVRAVALRDAARLLGAAMAEVRPAARPPMAAYELAAAYELCFAGAACLQVWRAGAQRHAGEPLWRDGLWVRGALRELSANLADVLRCPRPDPLPGDAQLDDLLTCCLVEAAMSGAPVSPFGAAMNLSTGPLPAPGPA
jgi:alkylation response protein AidB-like acyl-CoA dehydrogenase